MNSKTIGSNSSLVISNNMSSSSNCLHRKLSLVSNRLYQHHKTQFTLFKNACFSFHSNDTVDQIEINNSTL